MGYKIIYNLNYCNEYRTAETITDVIEILEQLNKLETFELLVIHRWD